jgi:hypothetical protein
MLALPDEPTAENGILEGEDWRIDVMNSFKQTPPTESELASVAVADEHAGNADAVVRTADS